MRHRRVLGVGPQTAPCGRRSRFTQDGQISMARSPAQWGCANRRARPCATCHSPIQSYLHGIHTRTCVSSRSRHDANIGTHFFYFYFSFAQKMPEDGGGANLQCRARRYIHPSGKWAALFRLPPELLRWRRPAHPEKQPAASPGLRWHPSATDPVFPWGAEKWFQESF